MSLDRQIALVRELKKADVDAEYGLTENGLGVAMSPMNDSEVEKMNTVCKKYGATPVFVKKVG